MIEQKYYDEFTDKQSFEIFIKDFNKRLTKLVKNTKVNRADYFLLETRFRKLHTELIKLNFKIELIDNFIQNFLIRKSDFLNHKWRLKNENKNKW